MFSSNMQRDSQTRLLDLPNECLFTILNYVTSKDLVSLCLLSRRFRDIVYDSFDLNVTEETCNHLLPLDNVSKLTLKPSIASSSIPRIFSSVWSGGSNLTHLRINVPFPENESFRSATKNVVFSGLTELHVGIESDHREWSFLWKNSPHLRTLEVDIFEHESYAYLPHLPSHLERLTIISANFDARCLEPCKESLKHLSFQREVIFCDDSEVHSKDNGSLRFPVLETLRLQRCSVLPVAPQIKDFTYEELDLPINIESFLRKCKTRLLSLNVQYFPTCGIEFTSLQNLKIERFNRNSIIFDIVPNLERFEIAIYLEPRNGRTIPPEDLLPFETAANLKHLCLGEISIKNDRPLILLEFLRRCESLESLEIQSLCGYSDEIVKAIPVTLQKLTVIGSSYSQCLDVSRFVKLKKLTVEVDHYTIVSFPLLPGYRLKTLSLDGKGTIKVNLPFIPVDELQMYRYNGELVKLCLRGKLRILKIQHSFCRFEAEFFYLLAQQKPQSLFAITLFGVENHKFVEKILKALCPNLTICVLKKDHYWNEEEF